MGNGNRPDATIPFVRVLDSAGAAIAPLPGFAEDRDELIRLYRAMVAARRFDEKAIALQRTGRLGTFASALGQEAVAVGAAAAMAEEDVLLPSFRGHGAQLWRGVTLVELFQFWGGDERGNDFAGPRQDFPVCIPVASHVPHAAGVALAMQMRGEARAALCILGDGATSKGDFYEALNIAGAWALPLIILINNNQWAISVPRSAQTAAATLAQKGVAAGVPGCQVDGNDVVAVRQVVASALAIARDGGGPAVIEALTYRMGDHTTADDASRYRDDAEVSRHWQEEPIARLRAYLQATEGWTKDEEESLIVGCSGEVEAAADAYLDIAPQPPESIFDHLYETLPQPLAAQRALLLGGEPADG